MDIPIYRVSLIKDRAISYRSSSWVLSPQQVSELVREYLQDADREHFVVLYLDINSMVIGIHTVSIGTLTESLPIDAGAGFFAVGVFGLGEGRGSGFAAS